MRPSIVESIISILSNALDSFIITYKFSIDENFLLMSINSQVSEFSDFL